MENEESLFTLEGLKVESLKAAKIDKDVLIEIVLLFFGQMHKP